MQAQGLGGTRRAIQREPFRYDFCAPYPRGRRAPHGRTAAHSAIGRRFGRYLAGAGGTTDIPRRNYQTEPLWTFWEWLRAPQPLCLHFSSLEATLILDMSVWSLGL